MIHASRKQHGVTLVELLVSIVIVSIAASGVLGVLSMTTAASANTMIRHQAAAIAEAYLEEIMLKPVADPDGADGEAARADFDDLDDYDGLLNVDADQFGTPIAGLGNYERGYFRFRPVPHSRLFPLPMPYASMSLLPMAPTLISSSAATARACKTMNLKHTPGFTLIELVITIALSTIVVGFMAIFIAGPVASYNDQARRAELVDLAENSLRRIARDIRRALPNSVRLDSSGSITALELLNTVDRLALSRSTAARQPCQASALHGSR